MLPLPPDAPPSFTGAIGQFNWIVRANTTNLNAGEPITLTIAVAGTGNLDSISLPSWTWQDFKAYQPNSSIETSDPLGLRGRKTFELVVVPEHSGLKEIPELTWSFFDPAAKAYKTLAHQAIPIEVRAAAGGQPAPTVMTGKVAEAEEDEVQRDIVHIKSSPGVLVAGGGRPWFSNRGSSRYRHSHSWRWRDLRFGGSGRIRWRTILNCGERWKREKPCCTGCMNCRRLPRGTMRRRFTRWSSACCRNSLANGWTCRPARLPRR